MIDIDTGEEHISPQGLEHQGQRCNNLFYAHLKMRHCIINLHQEAFPDLAERMKKNPNNASNIYAAFLAMLPLQVKGRLTPDVKKTIMKVYKL